MNNKNRYEGLGFTEYEIQVFTNMDIFVNQFNKSYVIKSDRPDRDQLIAAIKKYSEVWTMEIRFNEDYSKFKAIECIPYWERPDFIEKHPNFNQTNDRYRQSNNTI